MTSDDETRDPDSVEPNEATDAPTSGASTGDDRASGPAEDGSAADEVRAALDDIESNPLTDRAPDYLALADQLRSELERSDPSRDPNGR